MIHKIFKKRVKISMPALGKVFNDGCQCGHEPTLKQMVFEYYCKAFDVKEAKILADDFCKTLSKGLK